MKISILIPARNEAKSIYQCVISCLNQTLPADEIIVVNDASGDSTLEVLQRFENLITIVSLENALGNKSYAQAAGLRYVTGDIVITTDADTVLDKNFVKNIVAEFADENVIACAGYVKSMKHNWLTAARALEYSMGQEIHKYAQSFMDTLFVIPGCAAAFRTNIFKHHIGIDHDTLTEDLDFTYKHHRKNYKIAYCKKAIVYTQDPANLRDYIQQLRRWYGGSWQNLIKHHEVLQKPNSAFELSLIFCEGIIFPFLLILALVFNLKLFLFYYFSYLIIGFIFAFHSAVSDKRFDLFFIAPFHLFISFINYCIFIEQFFLKVICGVTNVVWIQSERRLAL